MSLLALDPSSTITGYAVLVGNRPDGLIDNGLLVPNLSRQCLPDWLIWYTKCGYKAYWRIRVIIHQLEELIRRCSPSEIVIEVPSGRIGTGAKKGARGSLTIYGAAAGAIWEACNRLIMPSQVVPITERDWTRGLGDKRRRQQTIAAYYRGIYAPEKDRGADAADAAGLGLWWLAHRELWKAGIHEGQETAEGLQT